MIQRAIRLFTVVVGVCLTTSVFGLEVPLRYETYPEGATGFQPSGGRAMQQTTDVPSGDWKLPELKSKPPVYAFAQFGEKQRLLILDRQNAGDFFYNRLYFDSNGNGDLTDDPVIDGHFVVENGQLCRAQFPVVGTMIEVGGKSLPYSFRATVSYLYYGDYGRPDKELTKEHIDENFTLTLFANCFYSGTFRLDGQDYRVTLGDSNVNGRFNDSVSLSTVYLFSQRVLAPTGDLFYLTTGSEPGLRDTQISGDRLLLNGKLFDVSISTAEGKLTLTPRREELATLKLSMATERLTICTEDGSHCVMMYRPGMEVMVPKGEYRFLDYTAIRKDQQGDEWFLSAKAAVSAPTVIVEEGKDAILTLGEPYMPTASVPEGNLQSVRDGDATDVQLQFSIIGSGKEVLTDLERISGNRTRIPLAASSQYRNRPKEPAYRIVKADGEVVTQGDFEYG